MKINEQDLQRYQEISSLVDSLLKTRVSELITPKVEEHFCNVLQGLSIGIVNSAVKVAGKWCLNKNGLRELPSSYSPLEYYVCPRGTHYWKDILKHLPSGLDTLITSQKTLTSEVSLQKIQILKDATLELQTLHKTVEDTEGLQFTEPLDLTITKVERDNSDKLFLKPIHLAKIGISNYSGVVFYSDSPKMNWNNKPEPDYTLREGYHSDNHLYSALPFLEEPEFSTLKKQLLKAIAYFKKVKETNANLVDDYLKKYGQFVVLKQL